MVALPLFVLPMVLMPGEIQELRVFEPRYRQMLDDCLLDERNFGLVMNDPFQPVNGWDGPRQHGCEVEILHHETKGSNHFLQIIGRRRFTILDIAKPALPPFSDPVFEPHVGEEGLLPDLQTLFELIPEDVESTKLSLVLKSNFMLKKKRLRRTSRKFSRKFSIMFFTESGKFFVSKKTYSCNGSRKELTTLLAKTQTQSILSLHWLSMSWRQSNRYWLVILSKKHLKNFFIM